MLCTKINDIPTGVFFSSVRLFNGDTAPNYQSREFIGRGERLVLPRITFTVYGPLVFFYFHIRLTSGVRCDNKIVHHGTRSPTGGRYTPDPLCADSPAVLASGEKHEVGVTHQGPNFAEERHKSLDK
ncbi:unnamed protein product [Leptidea sinapis]|uniref:Uncharacterized protein n=1 Tax=Leptidea sinapis TaxID=189913 RepID=A0A5E4PVC7_9NEOP|nr:unnamed protein product [Leptidea sinapis]